MSANPHKGEVACTIGGHAMVCRYTINAVATLEHALGKPLPEIIGHGSMGFGVLRTLLFYGVRANWKGMGGMTEERIGEMMDADIGAEGMAAAVQRYAGVVTEAFNLWAGVDHARPTNAAAEAAAAE